MEILICISAALFLAYLLYVAFKNQRSTYFRDERNVFISRGSKKGEWEAIFTQNRDFETADKTLSLLCEHFDYEQKYKFNFLPTESVMDLYRADYPEGFDGPDNLEVESFVKEFEKVFAVTIPWSAKNRILTLQEIVELAIKP